MKITEIYESKRQPISFEIFPPKKGTELENIEETLDILCELDPDFISITFGAGGSSNNNKTIALAKLIKEKYHVEPVVHLTCLCYDRQEIDEFIKQLQAEGIENILALRGDRNPNIVPKTDFPHASDLISYVKGKADFCISGACYPEAHPDSASRVEDVRNTRIKVDAGAELLMSQLFFDNEMFYKYVENCRMAGIDVPITPGIMPVINAAQITRMVTMCGASLPEKYMRIIHKYEDNKEGLFDAGLSYALTQIIDLLASDVRGIHLYTMNNPVVARRICEGIKNII